MDARLCRFVIFADTLADFDALGIAPRQIEHAFAHQTIVKNHVGFVEHAQRAQRQQTRIARTGADQRHRAFARRIVAK